MRVVVLVDGEHHPAAVRDAIELLRSDGYDIVGAVFCGGAEKTDPSLLRGDTSAPGGADVSQNRGATEAYGLPVVHGEDPTTALAEALDRWRPARVLDLADEPVLRPADRFALASVALAHGAVYAGADFELRPPVFADVLTKPSVRVFATGKRTGKTAVASALARYASGRGLRPLIVAVGRGGPNPPRVIEAGAQFDAHALVRMADAGLHAASDYVEDAITSGATTIGCRRVGGGLAGATGPSNVVAAARIAEERDEDFVILEGSGASVPDVAARTGLICVPCDQSEGVDFVSSFLNPYRLLLADAAVVTMAEQSSSAAEMAAAIRDRVPGIDVACVAFRPEPLTPVKGKRVFFCCTSPVHAATGMVDHLERVHRCEVVGVTHRLADRPGLQSDLDDAPDYDVLLTEIKGAAIDVAARRALDEGRRVAFVSNELVGEGVEDVFRRVVERAS